MNSPWNAITLTTPKLSASDRVTTLARRDRRDLAEIGEILRRYTRDYARFFRTPESLCLSPTFGQNSTHLPNLEKTPATLYFLSVHSFFKKTMYKQKKKTMYKQKIQSCHQDFQIRKVTCGLRSKTIVTHRNFRTPEDPSVISGISRRLCAISGSSSQSRRSFRAWTRGIFGNGVSRRAKVEVRLEKGRVTVVGRGLRLEQRSEKGALRCQVVA